MKRWFWIFLPVFIIFVLAVLLKSVNKKTSEGKISGLIIPHHDLAGGLIDDSFGRLRNQISPDVIVIYGTNHYYPVSETFTTTEDIRNTYSLTGVFADSGRVENDQSIQTVIPYIKAYFPNSKIIPILVSGRFGSLENLKSRAENFVKTFGGENTLYIASVDFAHNVSLSNGLKNNAESIKSFEGFNYQEILGYHDEHMDSPTAISTLLISMQVLGTTKWQTWFSSHGALITGNLDSEGTSYVVGTFSN